MWRHVIWASWDWGHFTATSFREWGHVSQRRAGRVLGILLVYHFPRIASQRSIHRHWHSLFIRWWWYGGRSLQTDHDGHTAALLYGHSLGVWVQGAPCRVDILGAWKPNWFGVLLHHEHHHHLLLLRLWLTRRWWLLWWRWQLRLWLLLWWLCWGCHMLHELRRHLLKWPLFNWLRRIT